MFPIQDNVPRRCPPLVTWGIIGINILIFIFETRIPLPTLEKLFYILGVVPVKITHLEFFIHPIEANVSLSFITSMFLHGGWVHVILNMWTLWIFGDNVEDEMGPLRFFIFYLLSGVVACVVHVFCNPTSNIPIVGASGAVSGVMGAYYTMFPRAKIVFMIPIFFIPFFFEIPAMIYLAVWFLQQLFSGALTLASPKYVSNIAWWAHVGGFAFGALTNRLFLIGVRKRPCKRYADEFRKWGLLEHKNR